MKASQFQTLNKKAKRRLEQRVKRRGIRHIIAEEIGPVLVREIFSYGWEKPGLTSPGLVRAT